jgi:uncharacterized protein Yka (UPF0111/DUF47 family)
MKVSKWFLPEEPDVVGLLRGQIEITLEGLDAFAEWAGGDDDAIPAVRAAEPRGDDKKRELLEALRAAFVVPLEPEDVFTLSRGIDRVLDDAVDLIAEAQVLARPPDAGIAEMAGVMGEAMRRLDAAIAQLGRDGDGATTDAEAVIVIVKRLEDAYYRGMAALLHEEDRGARIARRELYRRCSQIGDVIVDVAERVMYAVVKQT